MARTSQSITSRVAGQIRHFPPRDLGQLAVLGVLLAGIEVSLRCVAVDRVARRLSLRFLETPSESVAEPVQIALSPGERRWVNNVGRVVRRWPWDSSCLRRSLLLGWVLRGRAPVLMVGVRHDGGVIAAHAWVRVDGVDLDPTADRYAVFAGPGGAGAGRR